MEIRDAMQRQIFLNSLSSSIEAYTSSEFGICGSRIDSALSRTIKMSFEDRNGRREARSSGFSVLEPMALESRRRKWVREEGNWSQRMNRRSLPNRCLTRSSWRTVRAIDVLPIPPAPSRAIDLRSFAESMISSTKSSRPKKNPGGGGGDSPNGLGKEMRPWVS